MSGAAPYHRVRRTARVLLFDDAGRILLFKGRLPSAPDGPGWWYTVGGGLEDGETEREAARREILEETGFTDAVLGETAFTSEFVFRDLKGRSVLQTEVYILARCAGGEPSRAGWSQIEHTFCDEHRWWTIDELAAQGEPIHPPDLAARLRAMPNIPATM